MGTRQMLKITKEASACHGIAVLAYAIEDTVSRMYTYIWEGLKNSDVMSPEDYTFFPLHILVDDKHSGLLKDAYKYLIGLNDGTCEGSLETVEDVLEKSVIFFDSIEKIADDAWDGK